MQFQKGFCSFVLAIHYLVCGGGGSYLSPSYPVLNKSSFLRLRPHFPINFGTKIGQIQFVFLLLVVSVHTSCTELGWLVCASDSLGDRLYQSCFTFLMLAENIYYQAEQCCPNSFAWYSLPFVTLSYCYVPPWLIKFYFRTKL